MKIYEKAKSAMNGKNSKDTPIYLNVYDLDEKNSCECYLSFICLLPRSLPILILI